MRYDDIYCTDKKRLPLEYVKIKQPFAAGHMSSISIYIYTVSTKNEHISYIHRHISAAYMLLNDYLQLLQLLCKNNLGFDAGKPDLDNPSPHRGAF